ncbi:MAG: transcriptional regulator [Beijerinckiaceae bacterium]|nr:MAG: transcriptional regulator [Beijerinckiaceae bacterium]
MTKIFNGRYTARTDKPLVLFLIGIRLNKLWAVHKWLPVFIAMPRMLAELGRKREAGLLSHRLYHSGRIYLVQQYWESFDKLIAYAHDPSAKHFPAWAAFNRAVGKDGKVGIWHETYLIEPGKFETIYGNMPLFGLAAATKHVPADSGLSAAKDRMSGG